jgi:hypothetical protein
VKGGLIMAQDFLEGRLAGGIPDPVRRDVTVKIAASGRGNEEEGGGGACCTAFSAASATFRPTATVVDNVGATATAVTQIVARESLIRPFFDVAHPDWNQGASRPVQLGYWTAASDSQKTVVHEYTHSWQQHVGCISQFNQPLGRWINEGLAEYIAYEAMIARGNMRRSDVLDHMLVSARATGQLDRPLREFGGATSDIWPGHVGYLAMDRLVPAAPSGIQALRTVCEEMAKGASLSSAFSTSFGIGLENFYEQFEVVRQQIR